MTSRFFPIVGLVNEIYESICTIQSNEQSVNKLKRECDNLKDNMHLVQKRMKTFTDEEKELFQNKIDGIKELLIGTRQTLFEMNSGFHSCCGCCQIVLHPVLACLQDCILAKPRQFNIKQLDRSLSEANQSGLMCRVGCLCGT